MSTASASLNACRRLVPRICVLRMPPNWCSWVGVYSHSAHLSWDATHHIILLHSRTYAAASVVLRAIQRCDHTVSFCFYRIEGSRLTRVKQRVMAKLVIQHCLLLLAFTASPIVAALPSSKAAYPMTRGEASDTQKRTAKDLWGGWLHVVNKIYERLLEVRNNATEVTRGAEELRKEASAASANATELLDDLGKNSAESGRLEGIIQNISGAIVCK
ncbi:hypothetical protein TRVL_05876 [Trypanosoma vivax]|nr:hypothetical protein TRVL_05876 [Trypanosoma vivax]